MAANGAGDLTLFEALAGGVFDHLNCQHTREFDQIPRCLRGGMGSFVIDWLVHYVCDLTQANRELKAWFPYARYDCYARSDCCDR